MNSSPHAPNERYPLYRDEQGRLHGRLPCKSVMHLYSREDRESIDREARLRSAETERRSRARRRQRIRESRSHVTDAEWEALKAYYDYRCLCCGRREGVPQRRGSFVTLSRDHVKPVSAGGSDGIENVQTLCWDCNVTKGTRMIDYRPLWGEMP